MPMNFNLKDKENELYHRVQAALKAMQSRETTDIWHIRPAPHDHGHGALDSALQFPS